jgi:hypothetical protein
VAEDSHLKFHIQKEAPSSAFSRRHLTNPLFPNHSASSQKSRTQRQLAEEYKPGRYRFRADGKWRYITDKDIETAECRRRTDNLPRELFNRRCNVEATIFQLCYHTNKKKLKYRGKFRVQLWAVCRAAWINMRRIASYQAKQAEVIA